MLLQCIVAFAVKGKLKSYLGFYEPSEGTGYYLSGIKKEGFVIPDEYWKENTSRAFYFHPVDSGKKPIFFIDLVSRCAVPLGGIAITDEKLQLRIESIFNKKIVKSLTRRTLDTIELIITLFAGAGMLYFVLKLFSIFTHQVVTL